VSIYNYNKIVIFGAAGAGKSYTAMRIAELTGYPVYHLDAVFFRDGWVMVPEEEFISRQREIMKSSMFNFCPL